MINSSIFTQRLLQMIIVSRSLVLAPGCPRAEISGNLQTHSLQTLSMSLQILAYPLHGCVCPAVGQFCSIQNSVFPIAICGTIQRLNCTTFEQRGLGKFLWSSISIKADGVFLEEKDCSVKNRSAN